MLLEKLIETIDRQFPNLGYMRSLDSKSIEIAEKHPEVGGVVIQDDETEFIVYVGHFTHSHFSNYEENLSIEQKEKEIVNDVCSFLEKLFNDQVVMWGSHNGGGGWYTRDGDAKSEEKQNRQNYVWSGPLK